MELYGLADRVACGTELAGFVEFTVAGKIGLGYDAQNTAPIDDDRAVEQAVLESEGSPYQQNWIQLPAGFGDPRNPSQHAVQKGLLLEQVVDGIGGDAQLWEESDGGARL